MIHDLPIKPEPWNPADATQQIRAIAADPVFSLAYKLHATERLEERDLRISDILYVLKKGFVFADPIPASTSGYYRYAIESATPNSGGRGVRLITIPNASTRKIKLVTVMWVDETETRAGTLTEGNP